MIYDSGVEADENRILIFESDDGLRHLSLSYTFHMDGNSSYPHLTLNSFVIGAPLDSSAVSCVCTTKSEQIYNEMLREILGRCRHLGFDHSQNSIVADFERAAVGTHLAKM